MEMMINYLIICIVVVFIFLAVIAIALLPVTKERVFLKVFAFLFCEIILASLLCWATSVKKDVILQDEYESIMQRIATYQKDPETDMYTITDPDLVRDIEKWNETIRKLPEREQQEYNTFKEISEPRTFVIV